MTDLQALGGGALVGMVVAYFSDDTRIELGELYRLEPRVVQYVHVSCHLIGGALFGLFARMGALAVIQLHDCMEKRGDRECSTIDYVDSAFLALPSVISIGVIAAYCLCRPRQEGRVVEVTVAIRPLENLTPAEDSHSSDVADPNAPGGSESATSESLEGEQV